MIKRSIKSSDDGLQPPLLLARPTPFWKTRKFVFTTLLSVVVAVIYVEAAYFFMWDELPAVWQRLLGLAYVILAVLIYALATRPAESTEEMVNRIRRGQHSDFGKQLRKAQEKHTSAKLPVLGETSFRAMGGFGVFVAAACWWLSPLTPVKIREVVIEDLTAPLGDELVAVVLSMLNQGMAIAQPPILPDHVRQIAATIDDDKANHYQRGLKAIALGKAGGAGAARKLLAEAMRHDDASPHAIHVARALNEMYAWQFEDAATWYGNAVLATPDDPALLSQAAVAWIQAGRFNKAQSLIERAIEACGAKPPEDQDPTALAACLHLQAVLLVCRGKDFVQAELTCLQARTILEKAAKTHHPVEAARLNAQAIVYMLRARYSGAEGLFRRASDAWTEARGSNHPHVATGLYNRAMLCCSLGRYAGGRPDDDPQEPGEGAEELLRRASECQAKGLPENHPVTAFGQNSGAVVQLGLGRSADAQVLAEKALAIATNVLGPEHPSAAPFLDTLATVYTQQARYSKAEPYYLRAIAVIEEFWGQSHPYLADVLSHQAQLYVLQKRYEDADAPCQQALDIYRQAFGDEHPGVATALTTRGRLASARGDTHKARADFEEALRIRRKVFGNEHHDIAYNMGDLAALDNSARYYDQGVEQYKRAIEMADKLLGLEHPEVAQLVFGLARLHATLNNYAAAKPCIERALTIRQASLVPYHPDLAATLAAYAVVLRKIDPPEPDRADEMDARAEAIRAEHAEADRPE